MRTAGNILWLALAGIWLAIGYVIAGILNFVIIIGIPFGIQSFKLAGYALWPFGRAVIRKPHTDVSISTLGNVAWFFFGGWFLTLAHLFTGVLLMLTVIGIPLGIANIKMAGLALAPFGKQVVPIASLQPSQVGGQITSGTTVVSTVPMLEDRPRPQLEASRPVPPAIEGPKDE
jgi:uncharacterized membrane protein YccF (DUF307 family)